MDSGPKVAQLCPMRITCPISTSHLHLIFFVDQISETLCKVLKIIALVRNEGRTWGSQQSQEAVPVFMTLAK